MKGRREGGGVNLTSLDSLLMHVSLCESLAKVDLPHALKSLTFGHCFNQKLDNVKFPLGLQAFERPFDGSYKASLNYTHSHVLTGQKKRSHKGSLTLI